jgi:hypothetical protein
LSARNDWPEACAEALRRCKPVLLAYEPAAAVLAGLAIAAHAIGLMDLARREEALRNAGPVLRLLVLAAPSPEPAEED